MYIILEQSRSIWGSDVIGAVVKVAQANTEILTYPAFRALCTLRLTKLEDFAPRVGREPRRVCWAVTPDHTVVNCDTQLATKLVDTHTSRF